MITTSVIDYTQQSVTNYQIYLKVAGQLRGHTAHNTFKLSLNLNYNETSICNITRGDNLAKLLEETSFIVWVECTTAHEQGFEALDKTLQDIRQNSQIMRGITRLLSGDFRQTLPAITRGTPADEINACLKNSYIWRHVQRLSLKTNMRVRITGELEAEIFVTLLLQLGNRTIKMNQNVDISSQMVVEFQSQVSKTCLTMFIQTLNTISWIQTGFVRGAY
eukprot:XP_014776599.1 PREDICTED: uncharacterized protein LOC106873663 [Octopus bimaculoides]